MNTVTSILKLYTVIMRAFIVLMLGAAFMIPLAAGINKARAQAVSLRQNAVLHDNVIRLGDVFDGLDRGADKVLGAAPRPGTDMVLNARTLMRVAKAMDVSWSPSSTADQITLRRAATVIHTAQIEDSLKTAFAAEGLEGKYNIIFADAQPEIILPADQPEDFEIKNLRLDQARNIFEATAETPSQQNIALRGRIERLVDVPVLRGPLNSGDVIGARDITLIEMRADFLKDGMILSPQALEGKTPRRLLSAGEPLKTVDVEEPQIVERGALVTIIFHQGPLYLTAQGKAMENGARGDVIRVLNAGSNKTLEAMVTASGEVTVQSLNPVKGG